MYIMHSQTSSGVMLLVEDVVSFLSHVNEFPIVNLISKLFSVVTV